MPFTDEQYLDILGHLQKRLREFDPDLFELLQQQQGESIEPRDRLLQYLRNVISAMREQSTTPYRNALDLLNEYVETENGGRIDGIEVAFTDPDQELYGVELVDLLSMVDRESLIEDLSVILNQLESDEGGNE